VNADCRRIGIVDESLLAASLFMTSLSTIMTSLSTLLFGDWLPTVLDPLLHPLV
jgi:hypothetical protein